MRKGDVRKQLVLDTAEQLFYERGYENTSVQDILDALDMSKGGFYHHFPTKLSLLTAICERRAEEACLRGREALKQANGAVAKLNVLLETNCLLGQDSLDFIGIMVRVAYRDGCVMLRETLKRTTLDRTLPLMTEIVGEGLREGVFYTARPDEIGRLVLLLGADLSDEISRLLAESGRDEGGRRPMEALGLLEAYRNAVELLLNAPYGSVRILDLERVAEISAALAKRERRAPGR